MQSTSNSLEPFNYDLETPLQLPSIFVESFAAPDNNGVNQIINQFEDISMNYYNYRREQAKLAYDTNRANPKTYAGTEYDDDLLDDKGFMRYRPRLVDAAKEDGQTMLIQQNSMYIVGMITTATLLITAIMLAR